MLIILLEYPVNFLQGHLYHASLKTSAKLFSFQLLAGCNIHLIINVAWHTVPQKGVVVSVDITSQRTRFIDAAQVALIVIVSAHAIATIQITIRFTHADGLTAQPTTVAGKDHPRTPGRLNTWADFGSSVPSSRQSGVSMIVHSV